MNSCVLQPPNRQLVSDDVIGGVSLRAKRAQRFFGTNGDVHIQGYNDSPQSNDLPSRQPLKTEPANFLDDALERLRELRRQRQIRYRKKKDDYANTLEEETHQLQGEINKLEKRRRSALAAIPAKENVWSVATEYFRLFRYGLKTMEPSAQQDLLRKSMAPDVAYNAGRGPEAIMRSWKCLSMWFEDVELELEDLTKTGRGSIVAETTTQVTITERTLRNVFPHLSSSDEGRALADKLLNQRLVMRGSVRFEWDPVYCRMASVMSQSDLLRPVLRLLGTLDDTSRALEKALISPDFQWRSTKA
ncbi:hypothetical protein PC129_g20260 [Phytophthora cactorum]|uniref:BZIP domain-containing protein n=1 Tax=Phytophthora cactorum TaxID=29920 RepID=A0A8T1B3P9_9STRA|nr:hypothetical protein PC114_g23158 [Phytophthora cactorum]KAG2895801.1 hypothetical protein PC117_g23162 [Phytophthora cactorum]KAG3130730.1 hypothetical protein C6341_g23635 [Phytophthora cactorum]KAG3208717.1 hypothetical protein PC129_g20260 [Phytophthora cactorum]KAG4225759.1 hypothetical protein PC116_g25819 [Phytophthora cactorum]